MSSNKKRPRAKKRAKRMKPWTGWCVVCTRTGQNWYGSVDNCRITIHNQRAVGHEWSTRIARVKITELPAKPPSRKKHKSRGKVTP